MINIARRWIKMIRFKFLETHEINPNTLLLYCLSPQRFCEIAKYSMGCVYPSERFNWHTLPFPGSPFPFLNLIVMKTIFSCNTFYINVHMLYTVDYYRIFRKSVFECEIIIIVLNFFYQTFRKFCVIINFVEQIMVKL